MHCKLIILALLLALAVGCSSSTSQNNTQQTANPPATESSVDNQPTVESLMAKKPIPPPPPPETSATAQQTPSKTSPSKPEPESPTPRPGMVIEKAAVGSGDKGSDYGGEGIITTPVSTYFKAQERIMFEIQIPEFIRAYKFEHDFKGPKSSQEFMAILKKNGVKLPTLPPGHSYIYDPKTEQLMVERPK